MRLSWPHMRVCWPRLRLCWPHVSLSYDDFLFSHSSITGFVICKSQWNSLCLCPFSFWLVLGWNLSGLFSQNFIKRFPSAMRSCLPLQSREWVHGSGLCNTGLGLNVLAVDLAGRQRWLRVRWQCLQNHCSSWWRWWFEKSADLKQNFVHFALEHFQKRNDTCKAEPPYLQWVHGFAFMCNAVP